MCLLPKLKSPSVIIVFISIFGLKSTLNGSIVRTRTKRHDRYILFYKVNKIRNVYIQTKKKSKCLVFFSEAEYSPEGKRLSVSFFRVQQDAVYYSYISSYAANLNVKCINFFTHSVAYIPIHFVS